jgi:hypothetical protein
MFKEYTGVEERSQVRQLTESRPLFQAGLGPAKRRCLKSIDDQEQEVKWAGLQKLTPSQKTSK